MKALTLEEVVAAMGGTADRPGLPGSVRRVTTDSRHVEPGDLFFALSGDRFDGHDFVPQAFASGATAAVVRQDYDAFESQVEKNTAPVPPEAILIRVDDPVAALGRLGRYYRRSVIGRSATVVAVTGSNGKTTTKRMIAHVLEGRSQGVASEKSFNNAIGVPLTLLSADTNDRYVICEVGTNAPGEIAHLAHMVEPDIAAVVCVAEAHLEGLGTLRDVAVEKLSLFKALRGDGGAIVNGDQAVIEETIHSDYELRNIKYVRFGESAEADLRLTDLRVETAGGKARTLFTVNDRFTYELNVPGRHNVTNAMAAIAVSRRFNMDHEDIAVRLATFTLPPMRLQRECFGGLTIINDAYNANPSSLAAAVDVLTSEPTQGRRVLVVGDMRELGEASERLHREAAENIAQHRVDMVISVGEYARLMAGVIREISQKRIETHAYADTSRARRRITQYVQLGDMVLLKGSRTIGLEALIDRLRTWAEGQAASAPKRVATGRTKKRKASRRMALRAHR